VASNESISKPFRGQVAVITGANSGIGEAISLSLAERGATLCLIGRNVERLREVARQTESVGCRVHYLQGDLSQDPDLAKLIDNIKRLLGQVDVLVHSAGLLHRGPIETAPVNDFDQQYRVNVRAPYVLTQALLPMLKSRRGQIVFINSSVSLRNAEPDVSQYTATKQALKAFTESLRGEVNRAGIRVLSVYPGRTAGPMQAALHQLEKRDYYPNLLIQPADVATVVTQALALPRSVELTDLSMRPLAPPVSKT